MQTHRRKRTLFIEIIAPSRKYIVPHFWNLVSVHPGVENNRTHYIFTCRSIRASMKHTNILLSWRRVHIGQNYEANEVWVSQSSISRFLPHTFTLVCSSPSLSISHSKLFSGYRRRCEIQSFSSWQPSAQAHCTISHHTKGMSLYDREYLSPV